jgi:hypothetical protein
MKRTSTKQARPVIITTTDLQRVRGGETTGTATLTLKQKVVEHAVGEGN